MQTAALQAWWRQPDKNSHLRQLTGSVSGWDLWSFCEYSTQMLNLTPSLPKRAQIKHTIASTHSALVVLLVLLCAWTTEWLHSLWLSTTWLVHRANRPVKRATVVLYFCLLCAMHTSEPSRCPATWRHSPGHSRGRHWTHSAVGCRWPQLRLASRPGCTVGGRTQSHLGGHLLSHCPAPARTAHMRDNECYWLYLSRLINYGFQGMISCFNRHAVK